MRIYFAQRYLFFFSVARPFPDMLNLYSKVPEIQFKLSKWHKRDAEARILLYSSGFKSKWLPLASQITCFAEHILCPFSILMLAFLSDDESLLGRLPSP